jgi:hypothetical protein
VPLKYIGLSDENMRSELCLDWDLEEKLVDDGPSASNIHFSDSKQSHSEEQAEDST